MSPVRLPGSGGNGDNGNGAPEPIIWPDGLGPIGGLLESAGEDFEILRQGLIETFNLPYTPGLDPGADPGDDVTLPFINAFLASQDFSEELIQVIGRALGIQGVSTRLTDARHLDSDETAVELGGFLRP